jgi:uncharacterized membrane protein YdjX (TVP38/TMEM64 family)
MKPVSSPWPLRYPPLTLSIVLVTVLAALYLFAAGIRTEVNLVISMMLSGNIEGIRDYILSYGLWAPVVSVLLMILQSIIAPLPASLVTFANGLAFGTLNGGFVSLVGQLLASLVCFGLSRAVGRTVVERLVSKRALAVADGWFARWGMFGIVGLRMIPGPGFDAVSYAAGLTSLRVGPFLLATALGSVPQIALYAFLGDRAPQHLGTLIVATLVILAGLGIIALLRARRQATPVTGITVASEPIALTADGHRPGPSDEHTVAAT